MLSPQDTWEIHSSDKGRLKQSCIRNYDEYALVHNDLKVSSRLVAIHSKTLDLLVEIRSTYQHRLPAPDLKYLPPPLTEESKEELGKRADTALKRVAWRALCNPKSDIYKAWNDGLSVVYDKKYITTAVLAAFGSFSITATMICKAARNLV